MPLKFSLIFFFFVGALSSQSPDKLLDDGNSELDNGNLTRAENLFNQYHENVPFVRDLMNYTSNQAQQSGSIGTLLGRRCRFTKWEPNRFGMHKPMEFEEAERTYVFSEKHMLLCPGLNNNYSELDRSHPIPPAEGGMNSFKFDDKF